MGKTCKELTSHLFEIQKRWSLLGQKGHEETFLKDTRLGLLICKTSPLPVGGRCCWASPGGVRGRTTPNPAPVFLA